MIDLDEALAALVDVAPVPPDVVNVARRARQRRLRRRGLLAGALAVAIAGVATGVSLTSSRHPARVSVITPAADTVRLTMLDGSQIVVSGPPALGLAELQPSFNGALGPDSNPQWGTLGHGFSVTRTAPTDLGTETARFPTADGHELVVHDTPYGVAAVVQYGDWWLVAQWDRTSAGWAPFAAALRAKETADGYLVITPANSGWKLGPADAPELQLGGTLYGSGAAYGFWGPEVYPTMCPEANGEARTEQGWPVSLVNGAWWCDADSKVRVAVWENSLIAAALAGLRVEYADPQHGVDRVTALDGTRYDIQAPASELDHFIVQKGLTIDGLPSSDITVEAERNDEARYGGDAPRRLADAPFASADGHQLVVTQFPLGDVALSGEYGDWRVYITVTNLSDAERARVASLFAAHETTDGFLVLDPGAAVHMHSGPGSDIVLTHVDLVASDATGDLEVSARDLSRTLADDIHVTRVDSVP